MSKYHPKGAPDVDAAARGAVAALPAVAARPAELLRGVRGGAGPARRQEPRSSHAPGTMFSAVGIFHGIDVRFHNIDVRFHGIDVSFHGIEMANCLIVHLIIV